MKNKNKFELSHVVLYAKGWYQKTDDIFRDLRFALTLDDYSGEFFKDKEIIYKLLSECEKLDGYRFKLSTIYNKIQPRNTAMYGYNHNLDQNIYGVYENIHENVYDFNLAILYYIISELRFIDKDSWNTVKPIYGKGLSKPKDITNKQVDEMFKVKDK